MIDITAYRFRVGVYNGNVYVRQSKTLKSKKSSAVTGNIFDQYDGYISSSIILYLFYVLFMTYFVMFTFSMVLGSSTACSSYKRDLLVKLSCSIAFSYNKLYLVYFIIHVLNIYY